MMEILFKNGSTTKTIVTNNKNVRSSDKTFSFLLGMCLPRCNGKHDAIHNLINETAKGDMDMANATKEIKTKNILELWEDKQASHIENQYESECYRLHKEDSLYQNLFDLALKMATEIAKENSSEIEERYKTCDKMATAFVQYLTFNRFITVYTKDTMNKLDTEHKKYKSAKENLDADFHEIITMLSACDTYEQEMDVLKNYRVVDKNGKLNVPTV